MCNTLNLYKHSVTAKKIREKQKFLTVKKQIKFQKSNINIMNYSIYTSVKKVYRIYDRSR